MKMKGKIMNQDKLREQVRIAKALNEDWNYSVMSEIIGINVYSFYNWLHGYYQFSQQRAAMLQTVIDDLLE